MPSDAQIQQMDARAEKCSLIRKIVTFDPESHLKGDPFQRIDELNKTKTLKQLRKMWKDIQRKINQK